MYQLSSMCYQKCNGTNFQSVALHIGIQVYVEAIMDDKPVSGFCVLINHIHFLVNIPRPIKRLENRGKVWTATATRRRRA